MRRGVEGCPLMRKSRVLAATIAAVIACLAGTRGDAAPSVVQSGYAFLSEGGALYGRPVACPAPPALLGVTIGPARPRPRAVGVSFYSDPAFAGRVRTVDSSGSVNDATSPTDGRQLAAPVVGVTTAPVGLGYWLAAADGGVFASSGVGFFGSMAERHLNAPVVGIASTPTGRGYWVGLG